MHEMTGHALTVFMGFFAIMNPVANTPIFLGLTADDPPDIRRRIAAKALLFTFILIVIFSLLGKIIFALFGITLPAFQITGGILVFMIGIQMLHGDPSKVHSPVSGEKEKSIQGELSIAVTPLAIPLLGGAGNHRRRNEFFLGRRPCRINDHNWSVCPVVYHYLPLFRVR